MFDALFALVYEDMRSLGLFARTFCGMLYCRTQHNAHACGVLRLFLFEYKFVHETMLQDRTWQSTLTDATSQTKGTASVAYSLGLLSVTSVIMGYFGAEWPVVLVYLRFQVRAPDLQQHALGSQESYGLFVRASQVC